MPKSDDTPDSISVLWSEHKNFKFQVNQKFKNLDSDIEDLRDYLQNLDKKVDDKFEKIGSQFVTLDDKMDRKLENINSSISKVAAGAMDVLPKWAADANSRKDLMINGLFIMCSVCLTGIISVWLAYQK